MNSTINFTKIARNNFQYSSKSLEKNILIIGEYFFLNNKLLLNEKMLYFLENFSIEVVNEIISFQNNVYDFISNQRINFMKYIKNNFSDFFDFDKSSSVEEREEIYILLKIKDGFTSQYIFAKTGIIGVEIVLSDGKYIRYYFGNTNYF